MNQTAPKPPQYPTENGQNASKGVRTFYSTLRDLVWGKQDATLKEALEDAIVEHEEQTEETIPPEERRMLQNVLSFGDIRVSEIMTPRADMDAVPHDITLQELKARILRHRHTRIPVYQDTLDNIQGFVHVKDLLPMLSSDMGFEMKALLRDLLFVPPSMRVIDLLVRMRRLSSHMAIVVDEYGGTDGLVTMEDVVERIVGDIQDEHDTGEEEDDKITRFTNTLIEVSARIPIATLEKELKRSLASDQERAEFDTLGGLLFSRLGRVPARGEVVPHESGVRFEITDADLRRIRRVRIVTGP